MTMKKTIYVFTSILVLAMLLTAGFFWGKDVGASSAYTLGEETGYSRGYAAGSDKGYQDGFSSGYNKGSEDGYNKVLKEAGENTAATYATGYDDGYDDALKASRQVGFVYPPGTPPDQD